MNVLCVKRMLGLNGLNIIDSYGVKNAIEITPLVYVAERIQGKL
jgi:hypothetical protein